MSRGVSGGATSGQKDREWHGGDQPIAVLLGSGLHARSTQTHHAGFGTHSFMSSGRVFSLNENAVSQAFLQLDLQESLAERVGFEPTVAINHTAFRERHLQPLGHLSGSVEYTGGPDACSLEID
jgi:hypothetical protein